MTTDYSTRQSFITTDNIFVVPVDANKNIVYLPLHRAAFYINDDGAAAIFRYKKNIPFSKKESRIQKVLNDISLSPCVNVCNSPQPNPLESNSISIILHQKCNLECSYCFSHENRGRESLTNNDIENIIDWFIVRNGKKSVTFIGGGEPTLNWDLLLYAIRYIRQCDEKDEISIKVITNGTLLNEKKLKIFEENRVILSVSFDILPDIQNSQRRYYNSGKLSYVKVDSLMRKLEKFKIESRIRATITEDSVCRMTEMVKHVSDNYPHIKKLHLEHITDAHLSSHFYRIFTSNFFEARALGEKNGIEVYNSLTLAQKTIKKHGFCCGDKCFIPQPNGDIVYSFCHRFSSVEKEYCDNIKISTFLSTGGIVPNDNYKSFTMPEDCRYCFARWHCAGGCAAERLTLTPQLLKKKCEMVKEFCRRLLIEEMNKRMEITDVRGN